MSCSILVHQPCLFRINTKGETVYPISKSSPSSLPIDVWKYIFSFCQTHPIQDVLSRVFVNKQFYVATLSHPFLRLGLYLFKFQHVQPSPKDQIDMTNLSLKDSPLSKEQLQALNQLNSYPASKLSSNPFESLIKMNTELFDPNFKGYFLPLLEALEWSPEKVKKSADPFIRKVALATIKFGSLAQQSETAIKIALKTEFKLPILSCILYKNRSSPDLIFKLKIVLSHCTSPNDKPIVLVIVTYEGTLLECAHTIFKEDYDVVLAAYKQNPVSIRSASIHLIHRNRKIEKLHDPYQDRPLSERIDSTRNLQHLSMGSRLEFEQV